MPAAHPRLALAVRITAGVVFVIFGVGKFVAHGAELDSFRGYGLPAPEVAVIVIGVVEVLGGVLLLTGRLVRPAAALLAANMVGAIVVSGIGEGEVVPSLTLAPLLLVAMVWLLLDARSGPATTST